MARRAGRQTAVRLRTRRPRREEVTTHVLPRRELPQGRLHDRPGPRPARRRRRHQAFTLTTGRRPAFFANPHDPDGRAAPARTTRDRPVGPLPEPGASTG
ncbi:hypothetical protein SBRY_70264 [Actinacidiphila bryophytorum]|uniref:Uncharacterized protein n=1 Tax=Actinacidiphila bryophytorum TaxID=1436133 RepID=A0A9W4H6I9_9ACTN|nr:hypothetical protein SBRY_70264 [Actinacidiphila bryophytorum]